MRLLYILDYFFLPPLTKDAEHSLLQFGNNDRNKTNYKVSLARRKMEVFQDPYYI